MVAIIIDFLDDFQERVNTLHCNEVPTELHISLASNLYAKSELTQMLNDGNYETSCSENKGTKPNMNSERISMPNLNQCHNPNSGFHYLSQCHNPVISTSFWMGEEALLGCIVRMEP